MHLITKRDLLKGGNVQHFETPGTNFFFHGPDTDTLKSMQDSPVILWGHGWGQSHKSWESLVTSLESYGHHILLDFPGFGDSPTPPEDWGTEHYANAIAQWLKEQGISKIIWIGHSFGCRVGIQLSSHHPDLVQAMAVIAGAGLKRKRPFLQRTYFYLRIKAFKILRHVVPEGPLKDKLMTIFGSTDYRNAGPMRKIFVRVVNEDLSPQAEKIQCPVALIYGTQDTETPPEFGERLSRLIPDAKLFLLDGQDHYSVLDQGRHQVIKILGDFIKENANKR